jgi:putative membrane protein
MALLSAAIMTAWDLTMDPIMSYEPLGGVDQAAIAASGEIPAWRWLVSVVEPQDCSLATRLPPTTSTHFGVPWQNYQGWMLTAFVVFLVYRLLERKLPIHRERAPHEARALARLTAILPVTGYMAMALIDAILGSPRIQDVHLISPFAMGITAAVAAVAIFRGEFTLHEKRPSDSDPSG